MSLLATEARTSRSTSGALSPAKRARLRAELAEDERLTWSGEPTPRAFTPGSTRAFVLGLPTSAACVGLLSRGLDALLAADEVACAGLAIGLGALGLLGGLFLLSAPLRARRRSACTTYGLTDRRALVLERGPGTSCTVSSYLPADMLPIRRAPRGDGTHDVFFAQRAAHGAGGRPDAIGFLGIRGAREVEARLVRLRAGAAQGQSLASE